MCTFVYECTLSDAFIHMYAVVYWCVSVCVRPSAAGVVISADKFSMLSFILSGHTTSASQTDLCLCVCVCVCVCQ